MFNRNCCMKQMPCCEQKQCPVVEQTVTNCVEENIYHEVNQVCPFMVYIGRKRLFWVHNQDKLILSFLLDKLLLLKDF